MNSTVDTDAVKREVRRQFELAGMAESLDKLAKKSDQMGLTLKNGAEVGSLIGTIADEVRASIGSTIVDMVRK